MPTDKHHLYRVKARVSDQRAGVIRFLAMADGSALAPEIRGTSYEFSNRRFQSFSQGSLVLATFRISPTGRRYLLGVRPFDADASAASSTPEVEPSALLTIDGYYYSPEIRRIFGLADAAAKRDGVFVMLMIGPSGYGKTTIPMRFAEKTGRKAVRINCSAIRDPEEWLGFREARSGDTIFEPTEFAQALVEGNSVIVLDEVNRIEPWLHNTLFPLLDFSRRTVVHNKEFVVGKNTIIAMTMNRGLEYVGTFEMDQAFVNRADSILLVGAPPADEEAAILTQRAGTPKGQAAKIVETLSKLREAVARQDASVDCSTRAALKIATLCSHGAILREAFYHTVELSTSGDDRKKVSDILNSTIGVHSIEARRKQDNDVFA